MGKAVRKKKPTKAQKRIRTLKQQDPFHVVVDNDEWAKHEPEEYKGAPHTFVIYRGKVGRYLKELMKDIRNIMEPYTASKLQMRKGNVLKDYISIASYFHVTHLCMLSRSKVSPYLKLCRMPRGPSLSFRIVNYTIARDVLSSIRKKVTFKQQFQHHPLLIMNNFEREEIHLKLVAKTFQNMFPPINLNTVKLKEIRRVLLINYDEDDDTIDIRHYALTHRPVGVNKSVKKILIGNKSKIPNLGNCHDIADFLKKEEVSESEGEDLTETASLPQKLSHKVNKGGDEIGIKLVELGPRMKLQLMKVEAGILSGEPLYHKFKKTDSDAVKMEED